MTKHKLELNNTQLYEFICMVKSEASDVSVKNLKIANKGKNKTGSETERSRPLLPALLDDRALLRVHYGNFSTLVEKLFGLQL